METIIDDPTEPELPENLEDKHLEHDVDSDPLNTIGQPQPTIATTGSEQIVLEYGGVRINLGSSRIDVSMLCSLALSIYYELKQGKQQENGGDYIG